MNLPLEGSFGSRFAHIVSTLSSPFITAALFSLWIISRQNGSASQLLTWSLTFVLLIVGLPLLYIFVGVLHGRFSDLHIVEREQRTKPFIVGTLSALLLIVAFYWEDAPHILLVVATVLVANGIIFTLVTQFTKISIHLAAYCGGVILLARALSPEWLWLLSLAPMIAWARLARQRHTLFQTVLAAVLVSAVTALTIYAMSFLPAF